MARELTWYVGARKAFGMRTPRRLRNALTGLLVALAFFHVAAEDKSDPALLLANVWNASINPTGWWMSEKYDGLRGYWDGRKLWGTSKNPFATN